MTPHDCLITKIPASIVLSNPIVSNSLLGKLAATPGKLIEAAAARPVKISHESLIVEALWPAVDGPLRVAIKQYRAWSVLKALTAIFREAKAMQNWRKAEFLLSRDIATPQPLLACRPRGWTKSSTSYLATQWIEGAENLHLFGWRIAPQPLDSRLRIAKQCAAALGRLIGRLHATGAFHRDLKAANLLVVESGGKATVYLVDLDGLEIGSQASFERQARDLARLAAAISAHAWVTRSICRRFLRAYCQEAPSSGVDWKQFWRAIAEETAAYIRRKQGRGEKVL